MKKAKNFMAKPDFGWEDSMGQARVVGIDEVGYGAWAGPIVVAGVVIDRDKWTADDLKDVRDSKQLSAKKRAELWDAFYDRPGIEVCLVPVGVEDLNMSCANALHLTLKAAVQVANQTKAQAVLMDGRHSLSIDCPQKFAPRGDQISLSIALASVFAKVYRDRLMDELDFDFPKFFWRSNKGYGTLAHEHALRRYGLSVHHRKKYCQGALARSTSCGL